MRSSNGLTISSSKISHPTHDSSQVNMPNLQIISFNTNDIQLDREEDYNIVINCDIVKSMTEKPLKGGNDHEQMITSNPPRYKVRLIGS